MRIVSFAGPSDSGKTCLIEKLAALWTRAGFRVGTLKHCSKGYELDRPGKDSSRVWESGAAVVGIVGPEEFAVRQRAAKVDPMEVLARAFPKDLDMVLLEGFHDAPVLQVRVLGPSEPLPEHAADSRLIAYVTAAGGKADRPVFSPADVEPIASFLAGRLGLHRSPADRGTAPVLRHERLQGGTRRSPEPEGP